MCKVKLSLTFSRNRMATTAYLRVSTGTQDLANQKLAILEYARRKKFPINEFVEVQISSRKKPHQRGIDGMLERLAPGDRLIVSELSRLGRSLGQVIHIVDELVRRKIRFTAIKESIHFEGKQAILELQANSGPPTPAGWPRFGFRRRVARKFPGRVFLLWIRCCRE